MDLRTPIGLQNIAPVDYINDRRNLILLEKKKHRTSSENRKYCNLKNIYQDNYVYEAKIINELLKSGYLCVEDADPNEPTRDKFGGIIEHKKLYYTTEAGVMALKNERFMSERKTIRQNRKNIVLNRVYLVISIMGGILGAFATFRTCQNPKNMSSIKSHDTSIIADSPIIIADAKAIIKDIFDTIPQSQNNPAEIRDITSVKKANTVTK